MLGAVVAADSGSHTCLPYFISILNLEHSRVCRKSQYVTAARRILAPECAVQTMCSPDYVQSRLCAVQTMCSPDYVQSRLCAVQTMCSPDYVQYRLRIQALECSGRCSQRQPHLYTICFICSLNLEQSRVDRKSQYVTAARRILAPECAVQTMCSPDYVQSRLCAVQTMCSPDYVQYRLRIQALECSGLCSQRLPHLSTLVVFVV